jgi:hypothetical protein
VVSGRRPPPLSPVMLTLVLHAFAACSDPSASIDAALGRDGGEARVDAAGRDATGGDGGSIPPDSAIEGAFEPYFDEGFESYGDGDALDRLFDAAGNTTATGEQAFRGERSARMAIRSSDGGGFGSWGGIVPVRPTLGAGTEIWVRLYVYWPASFEFSASPFMKFLRLHNASASGDNDGYNDLYIDRADETSSVLRTIKEIHDVWAVYDGDPIARDRWERYEMYLFIDSTPVDDGGEARVRIWRDDALIFDRTDVPTIEAEGGVIDAFFLFTYGNGEMPPDNHCYVDELTIATSASPPLGRDAAGNPRIGDWTR